MRQVLLLAVLGAMQLLALDPAIVSITQLAAGQHPVWCHQNCPSNGRVIAYHQLNPSTGFQNIHLVKADGTSNVNVISSAYGQTYLPQRNSGNCEWAHSGLWLICQFESSASTATFGGVGSGENNEIWAIDPQLVNAPVRLAADVVGIGGGYVQLRISPDGKLVWVGHLYSWNGTSGVLGLAGRLRVFSLTDTSTPSLTGTGISVGINNSAGIVASTAGSPTGSPTCSLTSAVPTNGQTATAFITAVSGSFSAQQVSLVQFAGNGYTSVPTTWNVSSSGNCGGGTITTTGGALGGADYCHGTDCTTQYFTEAAAAQPLETKSCTLTFSAAASTTQAFHQYSMNFCAPNPGATLTTVSSHGVSWDEMGVIRPQGDLYAYVSSVFTPFTPPLTVANVALELTLQSPSGTARYPLTHFNTPGYPEYTNNGQYVTCEDFDWDATGTKIVININNLVNTSEYIYILALDFGRGRVIGAGSITGKGSL